MSRGDHMKKRILPLLMCTAMAAAAAGTQVSAADCRLSDTRIKVTQGGTASIKLSGAAGAVRWRNSNSSIFSYNKGVITAKAPGTAALYAVYDGNTYKCTVTVLASDDIPASPDIKAGQNALHLDKGSSAVINIVSGVDDISIRADNGEVCSLGVSDMYDGVFDLTVKALSDGRTTITLYSASDPSNKTEIRLTVGDGDTGYHGSEDSGESGYVQRALELVNEERAKVGADPLTLDEDLCAFADTRAKELSELFSHTRPDGTKSTDALKEFEYKSVAENIAGGYFTPEKAVKAWMNSKGHRSHILDPRYTKTGIAYDPETGNWVQVFLG